MWSNPQESVDLVTFTEEILNGKLRFLCNVNSEIFLSIIINRLVKLKDSYKLLIDEHEIDSENSVTLLDMK